MTGFFTRCSRRVELFVALAALCAGLAAPAAVRADGIEVRKAEATVSDDGFIVDADFRVTLTPGLEDALNKGVSLYFLFEFELIRPRWYWFNEKTASLQQQFRLSYNSLTRQYRIGAGNLYQNFATLAEALEVMSRVRRQGEVEPGSIRKDASYIAGVRLRLDTSQLPKPFQINTLGSREWNVSSDWHRWTVAP